MRSHKQRSTSCQQLCKETGSSQYRLPLQELHHLGGTTISPRDNRCLPQCRRTLEVSPGANTGPYRGLGLSEGLMQSLLQAAPGSGCTHKHLAARTCEPLTYSSQQWPPLMGPPTWRHGEAGRLHRQADVALRPGYTV